jgi:hypothetical protein
MHSAGVDVHLAIATTAPTDDPLDDVTAMDAGLMLRLRLGELAAAFERHNHIAIRSPAVGACVVDSLLH